MRAGAGRPPERVGNQGLAGGLSEAHCSEFSEGSAGRYDAAPPFAAVLPMTFVLVLVLALSAALVVYGLFAWERIVRARQAAGSPTS